MSIATAHSTFLSVLQSRRKRSTSTSAQINTQMIVITVSMVAPSRKGPARAREPCLESHAEGASRQGGSPPQPSRASTTPPDRPSVLGPGEAVHQSYLMYRPHRGRDARPTAVPPAGRPPAPLEAAGRACAQRPPRRRALRAGRQAAEPGLVPPPPTA